MIIIRNTILKNAGAIVTFLLLHLTTVPSGEAQPSTAHQEDTVKTPVASVQLRLEMKLETPDSVRDKLVTIQSMLTPFGWYIDSLVNVNRFSFAKTAAKGLLQDDWRKVRRLRREFSVWHYWEDDFRSATYFHFFRSCGCR